MSTVTYKDKVFQVPEGYEYYTGQEDGVNYTVIPVAFEIKPLDQMFVYAIVDDVLFVCDISSDDGLALSFPAIDVDTIQGTTLILLTKDGQQVVCQDYDFDWI